jgi:hypothetical protein
MSLGKEDMPFSFTALFIYSFHPFECGALRGYIIFCFVAEMLETHLLRYT